ncbi:MAG TPA: biliverdin-producing heme oxygenase, partial [Rhodothermales bacterium]|nr:biliverdin-producing heme oxygenase [Rhodothermales bacterium]
MTLKEITHDLHRTAERTAFSRLLVSGKITQQQYAQYLYQMALVYSTIETGVKEIGFMEQLPGLERSSHIYHDFIELAGEQQEAFIFLPATLAYHHYLMQLLSDDRRRHLIRAHVYCRHMGDLFGGQIIAKRIPGSGKFYQFAQPEALRSQIRALLTPDLGEEAKVAFEWTIRI